jgi:eukaryotic-like serine/threonine-protein kinase
MGEVYRARDAKLGRDVAIKVLPAAFALDPDRAARFEREARVLASLNHPHIAQIYGLEGSSAIVMELVDGETLADQIRRGPLKLADALAIARQIADALDAAHEKGIVHRDLKPSNLALTRDGAVKILDFGLAKDASDEPRAVDLTHSPTMLGVTGTGVLLGTAPYMSPEQARGKAVDKRTDIWAFGCVLFEMLTGKRAFGGETTTDTVAAILEREPDWIALPASVPAAWVSVLKRCLEKDPKRRQRDIADAAAQLDASPTAQTAAVTPALRRHWMLAAIAAAVAIAVTVLTPWPWLSGNRSAIAARRVERLTFESGVSETPALSPDGQLIAYTSDRSGRGDLDIWVQQRGGGSLIRLTDDVADESSPSFSPDGTQIAFRSERNGGGIYVVPALGGQARLVVANGRGPRFSPDGTRLAYWTGQFRGEPSGTESATFVIPLAGGAPTRLAAAFVVARDPVWAPDGRGLLFVGRRDRDSPINESFDVWYASLASGEPNRTGILDLNQSRETMIQEGTSIGDWTPGGLLMTSRASLWSVPLHADGRVAGAASPMLLGAGVYRHPAFSRSGLIAFDDRSSERVILRAALGDVESSPVSLFADGSVASRTSQTSDGETLVFERVVGSRVEIWERRLREGTTRLLQTVSSSRFVNPTVSPDGARVGYTVTNTAAQSVTVSGNAFVFDREGGVPRPLCESCGLYEFLSDGRQAVVAVKDTAIRLINVDDSSGRDIVRLPPGRIERPSVSPDDRVVAYRRTVQNVAKVFVGVVPGAGKAPLTPETSQQIDEPTITGRPAGWSADSRVLYLLLDTDGHRCLWAQKIDANGRLDGKPYPARHFHDRLNSNISTSLGNAVAPGGFTYETTLVRGNVWLLLSQ